MARALFCQIQSYYYYLLKLKHIHTVNNVYMNKIILTTAKSETFFIFFLWLLLLVLHKTTQKYIYNQSHFTILTKTDRISERNEEICFLVSFSFFCIFFFLFVKIINKFNCLIMQQNHGKNVNWSLLLIFSPFC